MTARFRTRLRTITARQVWDGPRRRIATFPSPIRPADRVMGKSPAGRLALCIVAWMGMFMLVVGGLAS
ncbi:MAG: hypothetical protein OXK76_07495 [Gammaproteobacteria bacterium]|nr:hypothetical protein [Gammaproteobacteria bacterium]